jgi:hypothetical protein
MLFDISRRMGLFTAVAFPVPQSLRPRLRHRSRSGATESLLSIRAHKSASTFCKTFIATVFVICLLGSPSRAQNRPKSSPGHKAAAPGSISFADVTRASGIDFHLTCGGKEKRYIMESMCGGVAVFDYDNDGWMDIFFVNGSTLEDARDGKCHPGKLYRNNHVGTFTDVSARAGITRCGWGFGVAAGDYDNDGWEDLYITYLDGAALYRNNG